MNEKNTAQLYWLKRAAIYLALLGFFSARCFAGLGLPPVIVVQPLGLSVQKGGTAIITTTAVSLTSATFTWCFNGKAIPNPTIGSSNGIAGLVSILTITNCDTGNQGAYSVIVQNGVGSVTSQNANVIVLTDTILNVLTNVSVLTSGMTSNGFQLNLLKPANSNCVIDATSDLRNWAPINTNSSSSTNISFTDPASTTLNCRFYRARLQ